MGRRGSFGCQTWADLIHVGELGEFALQGISVRLDYDASKVEAPARISLVSDGFVCAPQMSRVTVRRYVFTEENLGGRACLQLVESRREGAAVRQ